MAHQDNGAEEISLSDIWLVLSERKKLIGIITGTVTVLALLIAIFSTPLYRAKVLLAPAPQDMQAGGGLGSLGSKLGGLGSFVGLGGGGNESTDEAVAILTSRAFTERFLLEEKVLPALYEGSWNDQKQAWYLRRISFFGRITNGLRSALAKISGDRGYRAPASIPPGPSIERAVEDFGKIRSVDQDNKTGFVTLSVEWTDPVIAAKWVQSLVTRLNRTMRKQALDQAEKSVEYLQQEVGKTNNKDMRDSLYSLIEGQMKKAMLANVTEEFAFRIIDPAVVPEKRSAPRRGLIVVLGIFAGLVLGIFIALIRGAARTETR